MSTITESESLFRISHEIKNTLAVVKGYVSLFDGSVEKYNKYMPFVKDNLNHSIALLEDFSNIGKLKIELDIMDINCLLDDVVNNYRNILSTSGIEIKYQQNKDEIYVNGDYKRLKELFINIIKNAKEALTGVKKPYISIKTKIVNDKVIISFKDNGCGIEEKDLLKVGEPFFTTKKDGTGLGVYLSKEIINAHNGKMIYESTPNNGTIVYVELDLLNLF
ncbi:MAG: HAMP domain-containing histidine kinase [Bacilli bacterium]|nr:HAMP domain-containing histidine kinase [Bacilli bacterium]